MPKSDGNNKKPTEHPPTPHFFKQLIVKKATEGLNKATKVTEGPLPMESPYLAEE